MRAAVLHGPQQVTMEELPIPEIGDTEVLVKIAVGHDLCHRSQSLSARRPCPHDHRAERLWA